MNKWNNGREKPCYGLKWKLIVHPCKSFTSTTFSLLTRELVTNLETLLLWLHTAKEELVLDDVEKSDSTFDTS